MFSKFSNDNANIFAVSSLSCLLFISFFKILHMKHKGLSDIIVISLRKKEYSFAVHKASMINCNLLKLSLIFEFS